MTPQSLAHTTHGLWAELIFRALCLQETISLGNPAVFNCYYGKVLNTYKSWNNCIMEPWVPLFSVTNYHNFSVMFHLFFIGVLLENPSYYIILPQILQCTFITIFLTIQPLFQVTKLITAFYGFTWGQYRGPCAVSALLCSSQDVKSSGSLQLRSSEVLITQLPFLHLEKLISYPTEWSKLLAYCHLTCSCVCCNSHWVKGDTQSVV